MEIDFRNVQATVVHLYKSPISRHLIFRFGEDREGARAFLRRLAPHVTMADFQFDTTPDPLLNVGITCNGLRALGVEETLLETFDRAFRDGPDPFQLGDVPDSCSDPAKWWDQRFKTDDIHCIVHLYLRSEEAVEPASALVRGFARASGVTELTPREDGTVLDARSLGGARLHFGYRDGISHPDICWDDVPDTPTQINFRHFLLGHVTEECDSAPPECDSAPRSGPAAELVRDSSYVVFRWIHQDVATFNRFLQTRGPEVFPHLPPAEAEELLAAKLMGRWRDGTPLVLSPDGPDPTMAGCDDFEYATQDPNGYRCPFSAHIRVVNPRKQPLDTVVRDPVPRVIRRGMPYGPVLNSTEDDGKDRGIIGLFLCANIRRQIYTLTRWIKQNNFSPVYNANRRVQDPLVGNRAAPGTVGEFHLPAEGGGTTITGLPDFVWTKGTVFLLLPSKSTLQKLTGAS